MTRLTRSDWIDFGLKSLKEEGFTSLKADVLSKGLKVSRGSFYWHFEDVSKFHEAVIARWFERSTAVASNIDTDATASDQLRMLMQAAYQSDHSLERAFRAWAHSVPIVALSVDQLDAFRIAELTRIVSGAMGGSNEAIRRVKLLYTSAVGISQINPDLRSLDTADIDALADLLLK